MAGIDPTPAAAQQSQADRDLRPAAESELVRLHVGGTTFETTRGTLTSIPGSALARLYLASPTSDPPYHFDRDPDLFRVIINALRRRTAPRKPESLRVEEWEDELRFWGLLAPAATPKAPSKPTDAAPVEGAKPPIAEVPVQVLLTPGHPQGTLLYRLPMSASNHIHYPSAKDFTIALWTALQKLIESSKFGQSHADGSWTMSIPYRVLRRIHYLDKIAAPAVNYNPPVVGAVIYSHWLLVHLFLRGELLGGLEPIPLEVFDVAMRTVFKAFADHRLNEDLRYEVTTTGEGDAETLNIKLVKRPELS